MYMSRDNSKINFVLLFDPEVKVKVGRAHTDTKYGVCIENFTRYVHSVFVHSLSVAAVYVRVL